jgi:hypothetical protein
MNGVSLLKLNALDPPMHHFEAVVVAKFGDPPSVLRAE